MHPTIERCIAKYKADAAGDGGEIVKIYSNYFADLEGVRGLQF